MQSVHGKLNPELPMAKKQLSTGTNPFSPAILT
jgi:hypothetical protein